MRVDGYVFCVAPGTMLSEKRKGVRTEGIWTPSGSSGVDTKETAWAQANTPGT